jgi:hypothetical protein
MPHAFITSKHRYSNFPHLSPCQSPQRECIALYSTLDQGPPKSTTCFLPIFFCKRQTGGLTDIRLFCSMQDTLPSGITFPKTRPTSMPIGLSRDHVEISVRASREQFPSHTSQTSAMKIDHDESKLSADAPVSSTACRMSREDNSEGGTEREHP